jgi:hypothetical protein
MFVLIFTLGKNFSTNLNTQIHKSLTLFRPYKIVRAAGGSIIPIVHHIVFPFTHFIQQD